MSYKNKKFYETHKEEQKKWTYGYREKHREEYNEYQYNLIKDRYKNMTDEQKKAYCKKCVEYNRKRMKLMTEEQKEELKKKNHERYLKSKAKKLTIS